MNRGADVYKNMLKKQIEYRDSYIEFNKFLESYFTEIYDNPELIRIQVDEYNFIKIRVPTKLSKKQIRDFEKECDSKILWETSETIKDYRVDTEVEATVYEYGFAFKKLLEVPDNSKGDGNE